MILHRYVSAREALGECIMAVKNGGTVRGRGREGLFLCVSTIVLLQVPLSSLPQPSTLHLLRALCAVCSGEEVRRGKVMCEELLDSPPPHVSPLWRSEVMCVLATALLHLGECAESRKWSLK